MNYCALKDVKKDLGSMTTEVNNARLQSMIVAASAEIDNYCRREFGTTTEARYFDGVSDNLLIDDLVSVTSIKLDTDGDATYETTLASTDYHLRPYNESPKWLLCLADNSAQSGFAKGVRKGVEITGSWGYASSVPESVKQACIIQVCRMYRQSQAGYGTDVGTPDIGIATVYQGMSSDARRLLDPFVRRGFG